MNSNSNEIVLNYESNSDTHSHSHSHSKSFYPEIYDELIKIFPTCDDNTKIVSLVKYLSREYVDDREYKALTRLILENFNVIYKLCANNELHNEQLKECLMAFPYKNKNYTAVGELVKGFLANKVFTPQRVIQERKERSNSSYSYKPQFKKQKETPESKTKYSYDCLIGMVFTNGNSSGMVVNENEIQNNKKECFEYFDTIKYEFLSYNEKLQLLHAYVYVYYVFTKGQNSKLNEQMISLLTFILKHKYNQTHNNNIEQICSYYVNAFFPLIYKYPFPNEKDDHHQHYLQFQSKHNIYYLYYHLHRRKFKPNEREYSKIEFYIYFYMKHSSFTKEELYPFFLCYHYFILHKQIDELSINEYNDMKIENLFSHSNYKLYNDILDRIQFFYKLPYNKLELINESNINFTMKLVDLHCIQQTHIHHTPLQTFKAKLIKLEKQIFNIYKQNAPSNVDASTNTLHEFIIDDHLKQIYEEIRDIICIQVNSYFHRDCITLYPFGSVTQFLSGKGADIDIYMDIVSKNKNNSERAEILKIIFNIVLTCFDKHAEKIVSTRLCLFTFTYKNVKIDLNYFGVCSVLGGQLFREYALYDGRFSILAVVIKQMIKVYDIKNTDKSKVYLNSFSWMLLLLTFFQDILNQPVLPKYLSKHPTIVELVVGGKKELNEKGDLTAVVSSCKSKEFCLDGLEAEKLKSNKVEYYNNMSCGELLLKFLEFVGFYFNYEYVLVNSSFTGQCFMSKVQMKTIINQDKEYWKFYKNYWRKRNDNIDGKNVLIREPFDHTYNPAHEVTKDKMNIIQERLVEIYEHILKSGNIY